MRLSQLQEATYNEHPAVKFIKSVERGTDDYTQFPRNEIPQVVDILTRVFGQPKSEPRRTSFGGDAWREWYWEVDAPDSYYNIFISIPKKKKGQLHVERVARLGVEHYEYEDED